MDADFWDRVYGSAEHAYGTSPNDFVHAHAARIPAGPVLCLAEGEGRNAVYLAQRGHAVTAVDLSPVGLAKAERLAEDRGVTLTTVCADLASYQPAPGAFAGVVAIFAHVPPAVRGPMYARAIAALRPGGVMLVEVYAPRQLAMGTGGPRDPALLVDLATLRGELGGLTLELACEVERDVVEGRLHTGRAVTLQIIGVKP
ncbi:MAG: class I SAM-dependent methyltransferase [Myxococcales bacterium]|nr:class I SAM-dependent methyltransferase [Myxococcales bacterium]